MSEEDRTFSDQLLDDENGSDGDGVEIGGADVRGDRPSERTNGDRMPWIACRANGRAFRCCRFAAPSRSPP